MMMSLCIPPVGQLSEPVADRSTDTGMIGVHEIVYQVFVPSLWQAATSNAFLVTLALLFMGIEKKPHDPVSG
jgi:hypothetical protein